MRPHPRIRKTVKWGGAVVSVLLLIVWLGSGWVWVRGVWKSGDMVELDAGRVHAACAIRPVAMDENAPLNAVVRARIVWTKGFGIGGHPFWLDWEFQRGSVGVEWSFHTPLWPMLTVLVAVTIIAWRLDTLARRRGQLGHCPKCSYSRTGLAPNAVCPECGTAAPIA